MSPRRLTRAIVALAVPVLTVSALSAPAQAAKGPAVPAVPKVAKIYPHLAGATSNPTSSKVYAPGKKCKRGKAVKGATATSTSYMPADPADYAAPAERPMASVTAIRFRNAKNAISYLRGTGKSTRKCPAVPVPGGGKVKVKLKKIKFKLGDERQGTTVTARYQGQTTVIHSLLVRKGRFVVLASVIALDGRVPNVKKAIKLTALAVKTAR